MNRADQWAANDKRFVWHPFTPLAEWCAPEHDPLVIVAGGGAIVRDSRGREYIDGNSSIWTNLHGHNHPRINAAICDQLARMAHASFLGTTNPPAIELAEKLVGLFPAGTFGRVFFSDDGSTAIEAAIKLAAQFWQIRGEMKRQRFVAFADAYHGDTMGASSLGGLFHDRFAAWQFPVERIANVEELEKIDGVSVASVVIEPLIQGAAGMRIWPRGMLARTREWCDRSGALLIADEVMTGFGRTGTMFACEREGVAPDLMALAKGLSGGYLPLAATMIAPKICEAFCRDSAGTFFYGHSYSGNALGCAAALGNLSVFEEENVLDQLAEKIGWMENLLTRFESNPHVAEVRQCGFIGAVELRNPEGRPRLGHEVCLAARQHGLLTRPIRDVVVLMPPYCISEIELQRAVEAIKAAVDEIM